MESGDDAGKQTKRNDFNMTNELLNKYSEESKAAVKAYKQAIQAAKERAAKYGTNPAEDIDKAKETLAQTKSSIKERYSEELNSAISTAKQAVVTASTVNSIEAKSVDGFISDLETQLLVDGAAAVVNTLEMYGDQLTDKQRSVVFSRIVPKLSANGVDSFDMKRIANQYANQAATELRNRVDELSKLSLENPTLEIDSMELAETNAKRSATPGNRFGGDRIQPLYDESEES